METLSEQFIHQALAPVAGALLYNPPSQHRHTIPEMPKVLLTYRVLYSFCL
jgi:hypothetical protein